MTVLVACALGLGCSDEAPVAGGELCVPQAIFPVDGGVEADNGCMGSSDPMVWRFEWTECPGATAYHVRSRSLVATLPDDYYNVQDSTLTQPYFERAELGFVLNESRTDWGWQVRAKVVGFWHEWSPMETYVFEPVNTDCP
jgi:hypothetical protein